MRIAAKATLFVGTGYLLTVCVLALAVHQRVAAHEEEVARRAAHLVGEEIAAALSDASLARILRADRPTRTHLRRLIDGLTAGSSLLAAVTVVNERGTVVASDAVPVGTIAPPPRDVFGDVREVRYTHDDREGLRADGSHTVLVPLVRADYLAGYLRLSLADSGLEGLYRDAYRELLAVALVGLLFVALLGLALHRELAHHGHTLARALEAIRLGRAPKLPERRDEFSEALELAGRLGRELDHARREGDEARPGPDASANAEDLASAARFRTLTQIYRALAHELRTPLQAMSIHLDSLRESLAGRSGDADDGEGPRRDVETLSRELQRLDHSLHAVLAETAPGVEAAGPFDLRALVLDVEDLVAGQARRQGIAIEVVLPEAPVRLHGRRDRVKQALLNLVMNAFEAQPEGGSLGIALELGAGRRRRAREVRLSVDDAGPGIPPEARERVLELHHTTKATGTGIGLTVSRSVAEAAGGRVEIGDAPRGGARVSLVLPLADDRATRQAGAGSDGR